MAGEEPVRERIGHPVYYELLDAIAAIHAAKNQDYAEGSDPLLNFGAVKRLGVDAFTGILIRIEDKISRIESFARRGHFMVGDESLEDTLMDLANYALLAIVVRREEREKVAKAERAPDVEAQVNKLASFLLSIPAYGGPIEGEGACEMAERVLKILMESEAAFESLYGDQAP
jgi:hypothetical protein